MKYLSDYMDAKQTEVFNKYGLFFAFSNEQLDTNKTKLIESGLLEPDDKLTNLGSGAIVPSKYAQQAVDELDTIYTDAIAQDINENGIEAIIIRELDNHEYCITCDITDTVDKLADYPGIDAKLIQLTIPAWRNHRHLKGLG